MTGEVRELQVSAARLDQRVKFLEAEHRRLPKCYVTRAEHQPVKLIAFGLVGVVAVLVLGAVVRLAFKVAL